jgi:hypothetical protein
MGTLTSPPSVSGRFGQPGLIWERCTVLLCPSNVWSTPSPFATQRRTRAGRFSSTNASASCGYVHCFCQVSVRSLRLMLAVALASS